MEDATITCLVVEDDEAVRNLEAIHLKKVGHDVFEAADGVQGYTMFCELKPDLVVCDTLMPNMTGLELIRKIRLENTRVPIVCVSGGGRDGVGGHLDQALACGASAVLQKPFLRQQFLDVVFRALGSAASDGIPARADTEKAESVS